MILVTGGAGLIGANFVRCWLHSADEPVLVVDALTYAGNFDNVQAFRNDERFGFEKVDIRDAATLQGLLHRHAPRAVIHFAAESHVDRSIDGPEVFVQTNMCGTASLQQNVHAYWSKLPADAQGQFRFVHISTDEVYGSLSESDRPVSETTPYAPNSPYAASKGSSDHFVRVYHHTYGVPTLTTHCSNKFGPFQFPEKLVPVLILNALEGKALPVYGDGKNIRDRLYVDTITAARSSRFSHTAAGRALLHRRRQRTHQSRGRAPRLCRSGSTRARGDRLLPGSTRVRARSSRA